MGAAYTILGRTVQPHVLALATIIGTVGGVTYKMGSAPSKPETAPSKTSSLDTSSASQQSGEMDIEKLLDNYLQQADKK
ncbi:LAME_0H10682g1_1 [Lachancea meyersii CBS 8951]|uniref:LAME_0H10682g1_1 n=1 Tax=Lachancea meyersii CBS 8951 TaxID=1266667 RepID=A0A1G4KG27_9SACH|nr:LAME_0H10682g1_1 [Lachancea meyersii CBS 8951]